MSKIIKGIVRGYSNIESGHKDSKSFAYVDMNLLDNKSRYRFFFESVKMLEEELMDRVPIGSTVEFEIVKNGNYWNVNQKSFKLVFEGNGSMPESSKPSNENYNNNVYIVRQNALAHADAKRSLNPKMSDEEYFKFAEDCVEWVLR